KSFSVTVRDTTAPAITVPADITAPATSGSGAVVTYTANATDAVGVTSFACVPASGSTFPIGATTVTCTAADAARNNASKSLSVRVTQAADTMPPVITVPADITKEATGPDGAAVTYTATATDDRDGPVAVACTPASGATFPLGATTVDCTAH